ncbi:hypothetical protein [Flavobacterium sp. H122]|uniref:TPR end-of-group domain-containing protein n=1 Tax=Flavobacterium sp. H122 TaxID=2529860 RepID=UPI0010AAFA61|nr:hypothetical protein [Flavobacterium sp. H122]
MKKYYFLFYLITFSVVAQSTKEIYNQSTKAYQEKDYGTFLKLTQKLDSIRPSHPAFTYNLACAYALNNQSDKAFEVLERCLLINNTISFETEKDLESLKQNPKYESLLYLKSRLDKPLNTSRKVVSLSEKDLHPEGLTFLQNTKTWLAASIHKRKIVTFDAETGKCSDWFTDNSLLAVLALKADAKEKTLWVATSAMPEMEGYNSSFQGKSEVLQIDIKTKKILQRISIEGNHVLGDILIAKSGSIYVSDSGEPTIHKVGNGKLIPWLNLKSEAFNLQGITIDDDQKTIYIADYLKGILKIDVDNPDKRSWLAYPIEATLKGVDGLQFYNNSLIAIQNGVKPIRIVQIYLDKNKETLDFKLHDHNRPEFNEPTLGVVVDDSFCFFANAPWNAYDKEGNLNLEKINNPELFINYLK